MRSVRACGVVTWCNACLSPTCAEVTYPGVLAQSISTHITASRKSPNDLTYSNQCLEVAWK